MCFSVFTAVYSGLVYRLVYTNFVHDLRQLLPLKPTCDLLTPSAASSSSLSSPHSPTLCVRRDDKDDKDDRSTKSTGTKVTGELWSVAQTYPRHLHIASGHRTCHR